MKKRYLIVLGFLSFSIGFSSCEKDSFLDNQGADQINEAITFADSAYTMMFLTDLYDGIGFNMILIENLPCFNFTWPVSN